MMNEIEIPYGITKASLVSKDLLKVPHENNFLIVGYPAFGPNAYSKNLEEMSRDYSHPKISFREPTTSESISAATYEFIELAKPEIFDRRWLQAGRIVRTGEGVFVNPPKDSGGQPITNEKTLKSYLNKTKKINGIYLLGNDFGFAPYETFKTEFQDSGDFAESGLARALEHTSDKTAKNLREISSKKNYQKGVYVWEFEPTSEPDLKVARFISGRGIDGDSFLSVLGGDWGEYYGGCVFGVLKQE